MQAFFEVSGLNVYLQIIVTVISISIHLLAMRNKPRKESNLKLILIYTIGLAGWFSIISGFFGHIVYADQVAESIGWPIKSGFQTELAFAAIGIGLIGFIGFWKQNFWLPFVIAKSTFMFGAGVTHIIHMITENNFAPSNTGIVVYWDFFLPVLLITLLVFYRREQNIPSRKSA